MVSRRASFSRMKHGELRVGIDAPSKRESRELFESRWESEGALFIFPLLRSVLEPLEAKAAQVALKMARSLLDQDGVVAPRDAARSLSVMHALYPDEADIPALGRSRHGDVDQAAGQVASSDSERGGTARTYLGAFRGTSLLEKAVELDARKNDVENARSEIAEAEKELARTS